MSLDGESRRPDPEGDQPGQPETTPGFDLRRRLGRLNPWGRRDPWGRAAAGAQAVALSQQSEPPDAGQRDTAGRAADPEAPAEEVLRLLTEGRAGPGAGQTVEANAADTADAGRIPKTPEEIRRTLSADIFRGTIINDEELEADLEKFMPESNPERAAVLKYLRQQLHQGVMEMRNADPLGFRARALFIATRDLDQEISDPVRNLGESIGQGQFTDTEQIRTALLEILDESEPAFQIILTNCLETFGTYNMLQEKIREAQGHRREEGQDQRIPLREQAIAETRRRRFGGLHIRERLRGLQQTGGNAWNGFNQAVQRIAHGETGENLRSLAHDVFSGEPATPEERAEIFEEEGDADEVFEVPAFERVQEIRGQQGQEGQRWQTVQRGIAALAAIRIPWSQRDAGQEADDIRRSEPDRAEVSGAVAGELESPGEEPVSAEAEIIHSDSADELQDNRQVDQDASPLPAAEERVALDQALDEIGEALTQQETPTFRDRLRLLTNRQGRELLFRAGLHWLGATRAGTAVRNEVNDIRNLANAMNVTNENSYIRLDMQAAADKINNAIGTTRTLSGVGPRQQYDVSGTDIGKYVTREAAIRQQREQREALERMTIDERERFRRMGTLPLYPRIEVALATLRPEDLNLFGKFVLALSQIRS